MSAALDSVIAERRRQMDEEGWSAEHDDGWGGDELSRAASCYALNAFSKYYLGAVPERWPWSSKWWKRTNPRRDLVKAGALILAAIEQIDRLAKEGRGP